MASVAAKVAQGAIKMVKGGADYISSTTKTAQDAFNQSQASANKAMAFSAEQAAQQMAFQKAMMESQQAFNSAEARAQRKWQEKMRATAYQATVQDMIKAGINPILAAQLGATSAGSGTAATSGMAQGAMGSSAQAHMEQQTVPEIIRMVGYAVATAKKAAEALPEDQEEKAKKELYKWSKKNLNKTITPAGMTGR